MDCRLSILDSPIEKSHMDSSLEIQGPNFPVNESVSKSVFEVFLDPVTSMRASTILLKVIQRVILSHYFRPKEKFQHSEIPFFSNSRIKKVWSINPLALTWHTILRLSRRKANVQHFQLVQIQFYFFKSKKASQSKSK